MNITLTERDLNNIRNAFNILIASEEDSINYSGLLLKLGIKNLVVGE